MLNIFILLLGSWPIQNREEGKIGRLYLSVANIQQNISFNVLEPV
jgi:hypothetical protein